MFGNLITYKCVLVSGRARGSQEQGPDRMVERSKRRKIYPKLFRFQSLVFIYAI